VAEHDLFMAEGVEGFENHRVLQVPAVRSHIANDANNVW
jgi:hypothetical protein